ncbi:MAG: tRNA preQ1(34) S-adenosylmethionine ribosyltransferase-isomerase QueA [Brevinema sp.]
MSYFLDFDLPSDLIAAQPSAQRGDDRMMVLQNNTITHSTFAESLSLINEGDLIVFNNTKVFKARLFFTSLKSGMESELLLIESLSPNVWSAMIKKARRLKEGDQIQFSNRRATIGKTFEDGLREIIFDEDFSPADADRIGQIPLPPYIIEERRRRHQELYTSSDEERYQTLFARLYGSVAAPTASLRFTHEILTSLKNRGVLVAEVTLHVGIGTFKPMDVHPDEFKIHSEKAEIPQETAQLIQQVKARGSRVIAAGTTVCRTLEAFQGRAQRGYAEIFIKPGYQFSVIDGLITNFHLPQSTLLLLVQAFAGVELTRQAYLSALENHYQFFSYGDGMLVLPHMHGA